MGYWAEILVCEGGEALTRLSLAVATSCLQVGQGLEQSCPVEDVSARGRELE